MPKVLVTGGAGFIGSHLAEALLRGGAQVTVVDDLSTGRRAYVPRAAKFFKLGIQSPKLRELVRRLEPNYICHLAAQRSVVRAQADAAADAEVNIVGSLNLLEAVRAIKLKKFLFVSTAGVYGEPEQLPTPETAELRPSSPYAMAKHVVEQYLGYYEQLGIPTVVVRPANVYGPRQDASGEGGVVAIFCRQLLHGEALTIVGHGQQTRDFVYVTDVAAGMVAALHDGRGSYNLATSHELTVRELAIRLGSIAGQVPRVAYLPPRAHDLPRSSLSSEHARRELSWQPEVPLEDGLRQTLRWFKEHSR